MGDRGNDLWEKYFGLEVQMISITTFDSTKEALLDLLQSIKAGKIQLPDFQRGWVWGDDQVRSLEKGTGNGGTEFSVSFLAFYPCRKLTDIPAPFG